MVLPETGPSDAELVLRTRRGDRMAFGDLVTRYERVIGMLALEKVRNAADAEDIAQEAFLKAYGALNELKDETRFGSWLYGIAFRTAIDHLRRRGRRGTVGLEGVEPTFETEALANLARREESECVIAALGELPDKYRLVLTLRYQAMMSYQEIAQHLGEPAGTISNRIHRAASMVRARLKETLASELDGTIGA